jgi:hypothetical protein
MCFNCDTDINNDRKSHISEESKRNSLRSNVSKESYINHNEILKMLDRATSQYEDAIISNLTANQYSLKTALMMPIEEYADRNNLSKVTVDIFLKYSPEEELYGLFIVIKRRSLKIFNYLWEDRGTLWHEKHLVFVIKELADSTWAEGMTMLFKSTRTQEIFTSMYCNERKALYEDMYDVAEDLLEDPTEEQTRTLSAMMKGLVLRTYATLTFLNMFKFIHLTGTKLHTKDVDPSTCFDDLYLSFFKKNETFQMAEEFNEVCQGDLEQKKKYENILRKLIDYSFIIMPSAIPISRIWKSIKLGSMEEFKKCLDEASESWPLIITLRKTETTVEFRQPLKDERLKNLAVSKWKPIHLMIYYGRDYMIEEMLNFAHGSVRKALTLENKKLLTGDDFHPLKLCIRLKKPKIFKNLWNLCNIWTVSHLYSLIKEIKIPTYYSDEIMKDILSGHTAKDIVIFNDTKTRKQIFDMISK